MRWPQWQGPLENQETPMERQSAWTSLLSVDNGAAVPPKHLPARAPFSPTPSLEVSEPHFSRRGVQ